MKTNKELKIMFLDAYWTLVERFQIKNDCKIKANVDDLSITQYEKNFNKKNNKGYK